MFGPPKDVDGECNARLEIGDDYGDNHATMRCGREPKHDGKHREAFESRHGGAVVIEWEHDARDPAKPSKTP